MKIRLHSGGAEFGIVTRAMAKSLSVKAGFKAHPVSTEAEAIALIRRFMPKAGSPEDESSLKLLAKWVASGEMSVVSRQRPSHAFIHPRPIEASPRQVEEALVQRDPEPSPPPPPTVPVEPIIVKPDQLQTDAPFCEL